MNDSITLYNTLTRSKEPLQTLHPNRVTMYVCGPTVYNFAHIGNARPAVVFDVLARLLRHRYPIVSYVRNFTDVDDKINAKALEEGVPISAITERYIRAYHQDMRALGVASPDHEPRVTDHIPSIISLICTLLDRGHAYEAEGHVLFDVKSYPEYGELSRRKAEDMIAGARVEVAPYKKNPMDFVLWKPSTAEQPGWDSPWGHGRPGWHVECSAMIDKHMGQTIDIHGGGQDLIFPHHENEIAQGTCAHGRLYCNTWVHNSFVTVDGQKMSKSLGNVLLVRDLLQEAPGEAIRLCLLSTHYRRPLNWSAERLRDARRTLTRLYTSLANAEDVDAELEKEPDPAFVGALGDDLNTSVALQRLHRLSADLDAATEASDRRTIKALLLNSGNLLGLLQQEPQKALAALDEPDQIRPKTIADAEIERLVAERNKARELRDFSAADEIRRELAAEGIALNDTETGTVWMPMTARDH